MPTNNAGHHLHYIYSTLRELKTINKARGDDKSILNVAAIFPRRFLLKLVDERLAEVDELASELVSGLFKRLLGMKKKQLDDLEVPNSPGLSNSKCFELDKYFHCCLYYLHDFFVELDWHESGFGASLPTDDSYQHVSQFSLFQKALTDFNSQTVKLASLASPSGSQQINKTTKSTNPTISKIRSPDSSLSSPQSGKCYKSSLSSTSKIDSPTRGLRVKFRDQAEPNQGKNGNELHTRDNLSILALDLLIYGLNLFVERLCNHLNDWYKSEFNLKEILSLVKDSKQKLRTQQLKSISKRIKNSNDIYLTVLDHLAEIRDQYLPEYVLDILCAVDRGRSLCLYKRGRVRVFVQRILAEVERKVLIRLAIQCLQLSLDLMINEINLPPLELDSTKEGNKSRENHFNFITSWLNVDDIVFGFVKPKSKVDLANNNSSTLTNNNKTNEGLDVQFKSSSRILAQMDNLQELIRDLLDVICDRLLARRQLAYFLSLFYAGFNDSFDIISHQLSNQLSGLKQDETKAIKEDLSGVKNINKSIDLMAAKIRSLKLIHILTLINRLIKETASRAKVELVDDSLETKLIQFTEKCTQQTANFSTSEAKNHSNS